MYARKTYKSSPYIIKHVRRGEAPHRSTSWKVAYADFVTAMMAFFLLLWLYASMDSKQKTDIAQYFTPTVGVAGKSGADGTGGLDSRSTSGKSVSATGEAGIVAGQLQQGPVLAKPADNPVANEDADNLSLARAVSDLDSHAPHQVIFMAINQDIKQMLQKDDASLNNNIVIAQTADTLKIHLINDPKNPIFVPKNATFTTLGKSRMEGLSKIISIAKREILIKSHTATKDAVLDPQYTGWELSADRAKAVKQALATGGVEERCITRMESYADNKPFIPTEPANPRNNRVTIIVLGTGC